LSLLLKYSLWLGGLLLLVAGAITGAALWSMDRALTREALLRGHSIALNVAASAGTALLRQNDLQLVGLGLSATKDHADVLYAAILDAKGRVKGHPDPKALGKPLDLQLGPELQGAPAGSMVREAVKQGHLVWDIRVPIRVKGSARELGAVHVGLAQDSVADAVRASLGRLALISLLLLALGLGATAWSVKLAVRPLGELADGARRVGRGRFDTRVPVRGEDELGQLASTFNSMVEGLESAEAAREEHQRIESELDLARGIQASMLPTRPPQVAGADIAFRCSPAKELGGDFYDCIPLEHGAIGLLIADVSGKGVPAALNVVNLRNLFRVVAPGSPSAVETVKRVNALAYPDLRGESFVTLIYAVLQPATGQVELLNAGHDPAFWLKGDGQVQALESGAMPVGLADAEDYDADVQGASLRLAPGERLLLFTDGVTEAMDAEGRQFGLDALRALAAPPGSASDTVLRLADAVSNHANGVPPSDDVTLLALRYTG
jgi:serine phosphatase RsbU (regulator of sigma subunit)